MLLDVADLRVDYPGLIAVDGVTIQLEAGDGYALVGPNGAGKTSTFRAIAGLLEPTRGSVRILGFSHEESPEPYRRQLGYMPDDSPVIDRLRAAEFLDHFARAYGVAHRADRVEECLTLTGLRDRADAECRELSRGMKQRLVLARTLLHDPSVLVLDEPASGLDPISRRELRLVLNGLRAQGRALLVSSHILGEIAEFCNKVGVLERGTMRASGPIETLASEIGTRTFRVRWREDGPDGFAILDAAPGLTVVRRDLRGAEFQFTAGNESLDAVLGALVGAGVRVTEWRPNTDDLEHVFLELGARETR